MEYRLNKAVNKNLKKGVESKVTLEEAEKYIEEKRAEHEGFDKKIVITERVRIVEDCNLSVSVRAMATGNEGEFRLKVVFQRLDSFITISLINLVRESTEDYISECLYTSCGDGTEYIKWVDRVDYAVGLIHRMAGCNPDGLVYAPRLNGLMEDIKLAKRCMLLSDAALSEVDIRRLSGVDCDD